MKMRVVRYVLGSVVLAAHFCAIFLYFVLGTRVFDEIQDIIVGVLTVSQVTSIYSLAFVRYVTKNPTTIPSEAGQRMEIAPFVVQLCIILVFAAALNGGIWYILTTGEINFDWVKVFTGSLDTLFGAYLAAIFGTLFPRELVLGPEDGMTVPEAAAGAAGGGGEESRSPGSAKT